MRTNIRLGAWLAAASLIAASFGSSANAQTTALRIGTSSSGSVFYTLGVGLSAMLSKNAGIAATAEPVGGSTANMFAIGADKVDLAFGNALAAYDALHGNKPFSKKVALGLIVQGAPNLRQIIVRVGSGIGVSPVGVSVTDISKGPPLAPSKASTAMQ